MTIEHFLSSNFLTFPQQTTRTLHDLKFQSAERNHFFLWSLSALISVPARQ